MAIAYSSSAGNSNAAAGTNLTLFSPTTPTAAAGDLLLAFVALNGTTPGAVGDPAGWTRHVDGTGAVTGSASFISYRVATGSESSTYAWTTGATGSSSGCILCYSGVSSTPFDVAGSSTTFSNTTTPTTPSVTTVTPNAWYIGFAMSNTGSLNWTSAAVTVRVSSAFTTGPTYGADDLLVASPGATGTQAWTIGTKSAGVTFATAIKPPTAAAAAIPDLAMATMTH